MALAVLHGPRLPAADGSERLAGRPRFLLCSRPQRAVRQALDELAAELAARDHLGEPTVSWDDALDGAVLEVDLPDGSRSSARSLAAEELFASVAAVLGDVDWFQLRCLDVPAR